MARRKCTSDFGDFMDLCGTPRCYVETNKRTKLDPGKKKLCRQRNERKRKVFFPEEKAPFKKLSLEKKRNSGEHKKQERKGCSLMF